MTDLLEGRGDAARLTEPAAGDPRRLIVVRKRWTGTTGWSDAIQKFYEFAAARFASAELLEVSVRGWASLRTSNRELEAAANLGGSPQQLVVMVNHSICWWALSPTLISLRRAGATVVLCMHEHEHILGLGYVWRHRKELPWKEVLRHSRLYHGIPARASSRVMVLTEAQAAILGVDDAVRASYLPVDPTLFPPDLERTREHRARPIVLFAHDPDRFDKGHRFVGPVQMQMQVTVDWAYGRKSNLAFNQVFQKYWGADILFLPSDWESYSLVFVEALACNKLIVCSPHVGAAKLLQAKYSLDALAAFGVYITSHDEGAYSLSLDHAARRASAGELPSTRRLFDEFQFGAVQLPSRLL